MKESIESSYDMDLSQSIDIKNIKSISGEKDKSAVIAELVELLCTNEDISQRDEIYKAVIDREAIRSTGVGKGFAIPHCKTNFVEKVSIAFGICQHPIEFDSIDHEPVKLIALLVSPSTKTGAHIQALAGVSRAITSPGVREKLFEPVNPETSKPWQPKEIHSLIVSSL